MYVANKMQHYPFLPRGCTVRW